MKTRCRLLALFCSLIGLVTCRAATNDYDEAHRFVFYAVLEGCYEDGLSSNDVAQVLMRREGENYYFHFVYACPLCTPALHAFNVYRAQPQFFGMKDGTPTFGSGLEPELRRELYSEKTEDRLTAINTLVQRWIKRRMTMLKLSDEDRARLQKALEVKRDEGTQMLKKFAAKGGGSSGAPAYGAKDECAICNAAVGMALRWGN